MVGAETQAGPPLQSQVVQGQGASEVYTDTAMQVVQMETEGKTLFFFYMSPVLLLLY